MDMEEEAGGLFWQAKAYHRYSGIVVQGTIYIKCHMIVMTHTLSPLKKFFPFVLAVTNTTNLI